MKKLTLLILFVILISCSDKKDEVKILENYDAQYFTDEQVDKTPGEDSEFEMMSDDLDQAMVEATKDFDLPLKTYISFRIYINEKGAVDGVKDLPVPDNQIPKAENYKEVDPNDLMQWIAKAAGNWKFSPALIKDNPVKYRGDIEIMINVDENGKVTSEMPALAAMAKNLSKLSKGLSKLNFDKNNEYYIAVEQQPFPIGGLEAIQEKINYPSKAKQNGVEGRVFVKAYINEKGEVDEVELLKGIDSECDSSAMEAVRQTKFTPGKQRGKAVKVQVSIPIVFKLN